MSRNGHEYHIENVCAGMTACLCFQAAPMSKWKTNTAVQMENTETFICGPAKVSNKGDKRSKKY